MSDSDEIKCWACPEWFKEFSGEELNLEEMKKAFQRDMKKREPAIITRVFDGNASIIRPDDSEAKPNG